jgi:hypothetical protein
VGSDLIAGKKPENLPGLGLGLGWRRPFRCDWAVLTSRRPVRLPYGSLITILS